MITQRLKIEKQIPSDWEEGAFYEFGDVVSYTLTDPETDFSQNFAYKCITYDLAFGQSEDGSIVPPPEAESDWEPLSSYALPTGNIVKDDNSLFVAWGHNIDNMGENNLLIEDLWSNEKLYSNNVNPKVPKIFTVESVSWNFEGTVNDQNKYTFTIQTKENLNSGSLAIGQDVLTFSNIKLIGYISQTGQQYEFVLDGVPLSSKRGAVSNIDTNANTISFQQNLPYIINNRNNVNVDKGLAGIKSVEFVLAVLQRNES